MNSYAHHGLLPTNIPLHCNICPKKPDFSDVSHLLTHIASKGHLSHYYRMKVQAGTDLASEQAVAEYDEWYEEWNVQDLMRERMSQKERKKGGGANGTSGGVGGSRRTSTAHSASTTARNTPAPVARSRRPYALRESTLDPQLDRMVKQEPKSRSTTPALPFTMDPAAMSRQYAPPMQPGWSVTPFVDSPMTMTHDTSVMDSLYNTPTTDSLEDEMPRRITTRQRGRNMSGSNQSLEVDAGPDFEVGQGEHLQLKGVRWPGMELFDAATPDMKRKRNQKKAISVVDRLRDTSEAIHAKECVYEVANWGSEPQRERPITGNPEEDDGRSPLKGESEPEPDTPPKKKKAARPRTRRPALRERNTNNGRATRRRAESHHPPFGTTTRRTPYFDGSDDRDYDLTYGRHRAGQRTGLSIHRDNSGPDITFDHPAPMETLTAGFDNPFQPGSNLQPHAQSMIQNGYATHNHARQSSLQMGGGGFRPAQHNPLAVFAPPNFGVPSFGQLSSASMFANGNLHNDHGGAMPMQMQNGQQVLNSFPQTFVPNHFGHLDIGGYQHHHHNNTALQVPSAWDVFGSGHVEMALPPAPAESSFQMSGDLTPANPLFFSSNRGVPDDDEATISPPSERGGRREC